MLDKVPNPFAVRLDELLRKLFWRFSPTVSVLRRTDSYVRVVARVCLRDGLWLKSSLFFDSMPCTLFVISNEATAP